MSDVKISCQPLGCITVVLGVVALWALVFGVTVGGKHYGLSTCNRDGGVNVDTGAAK